MKFVSFFILFIILLLTSCIEDYQLPGTEQQSTLVISGLITNEPGPYYVKIVECVSDITTGRITQRGINDARVTITDQTGARDELRGFHTIVPDSTETSSGTDVNGNPYNYYRYFLKIPDYNGGHILYYLESDNYRSGKKYDMPEGLYFTTSIEGIPGQTYTLKVQHDGHEYTATDYMCYGTVLDTITVEPIGRYVYDKPDGSDGFMVPCLFFSEPQDEVNFYMFMESLTDVYRDEQGFYQYNLVPTKDLVLRSWSGGDWYISVISDRFLPPYVSRYKMSDGDSHRKYYSGTDMGFHERWENGGDVDMFCITEPVYRYYQALSKQYYDDGGTFNPAPASPPTNIRGGAQGCFSAASVSQYSVRFNDYRW